MWPIALSKGVVLKLSFPPQAALSLNQTLCLFPLAEPEAELSSHYSLQEAPLWAQVQPAQ